MLFTFAYVHLVKHPSVFWWIEKKQSKIRKMCKNDCEISLYLNRPGLAFLFHLFPLSTIDTPGVSAVV